MKNLIKDVTNLGICNLLKTKTGIPKILLLDRENKVLSASKDVRYTYQEDVLKMFEIECFIRNSVERFTLIFLPS